MATRLITLPPCRCHAIDADYLPGRDILHAARTPTLLYYAAAAALFTVTP